MKCFYHSADLDGHCSGAIVKYFNPSCEMFGINYGDEFPWGVGERDETVYMVDFSLQPFGDMVKLWGGKNLIWIDHHISAIKDSESKEYQMSDAILGLRRDGIGACGLVWEYFSKEPAPYPVQLLAEYDVWNHSDPNALPFQYGIRMYHTRPDDDGMDFWVDFFDSDRYDGTAEIIEQGKLLLRHISSDNSKYAKACAFDTELDGLKCIAINKMLTNSQLFDSVWDKEKYDAMLTFGFRKGAWTVSLYTDKDGVDVSVIAKARGGGGHVQAAGFQCDKLPLTEVPQ